MYRVGVSVEPVNATPATLVRHGSRADLEAVARQKLQHGTGTPLACSIRTAAAAISGVCSAGLAITALPAASAAATWPVKIASGSSMG